MDKLCDKCNECIKIINDISVRAMERKFTRCLKCKNKGCIYYNNPKVCTKVKEYMNG